MTRLIDKTLELNDKKLTNEILSSKSIDFKEDFNTQIIIDALTNWGNFNYDEIQFRLSKTTLIQYLGVLTSVIKQGFKLSKSNIDLFFIFNNHETYLYPSIDYLELNCLQNYPNNNYETEIFESCMHYVLDVLNEKLSNSNLEIQYNFENALWGSFNNSTENFGKISVLDFLKKCILYNIQFSRHLRDWEYKINDKSFNIRITETKLKKLYQSLTPDFIDEEKTCLTDFLNVLTKDWDYSIQENSIIDLKMDHYQTYLFWEWFCKYYQVRWTLEDIESSKLIKNLSAKKGTFTASTISNSRKRPRKKHKEDEDNLLKKQLERV